MKTISVKRNSKTNKLIERGKKTRRDIMKESVDIASAEGLEGLTIGRLARDLKMSKSGLFAHFGSKEGLQIATVKKARDIFIKEVIAPSSNRAPGLEKLIAMLRCWNSYVSRNVFRGGCFFFAASAEMDDRPGKVRDLVAELTKTWVIALEDEVKNAVDQKELRKSCDAELLVFQLHGYVQEANWFHRLHSDRKAFYKSWRSIEQRLESNALKKGKAVIKSLEKEKV